MRVYYFVPFIVSNRYLLFWVSNGHNSVTVQNRAHVYMNFFHHKDLGNHLLQLCPKVVKHPVYTHGWGESSVHVFNCTCWSQRSRLLSRIAQGYHGFFRNNNGNKREVITAKLSRINYAGSQNLRKATISFISAHPSVRTDRTDPDPLDGFSLNFDIS